VAVVVKLPEVPFKTPIAAQDWLRWSSVVGIGAAVFFTVCINVLGARFDHRWDTTSDLRYTLSSTTRDTLSALHEPIKLNVLLSRSDSLAASIQQMLAGYLSRSSQLSLRWVDPDRDPGQYLALQSELGISPGASQDGKSINESILVLTRGKLRSYVTLDDIIAVDAKTGESEPRLEQAITRALRQVIDSTRPLVCLTQGHRELNPADEGPSGLSELRNRLVREPIQLKTVDLGTGRAPELSGCRVAVVAAPDVPLSNWAQQQLQAFVASGGSLLVLSNTIPDESGQVRSSGLNPLLSLAGVAIASNIVVEQDEHQRLPDGFGETFFAHVFDHPATRSLVRADASRSLRVLVALAPSLHVIEPQRARALLASTSSAITVENVGAYLRESANGRPPARSSEQPQVLSIAAEFEAVPHTPAHRVVVAPASVAENRALRLPSLVGNRAFIDGALTWLLAREVGIEIANAHRTNLQMNLSEADLAQLNRYVLLIMPASVTGIGIAIGIARRRRKRSRPARRET